MLIAGKARGAVSASPRTRSGRGSFGPNNRTQNVLARVNPFSRGIRQRREGTGRPGQCSGNCQATPRTQQAAAAWKRPTSRYLALQFGIRAGNAPLTEEDFEHNGLPKSLRGLEDRIFGPSIQPDRLLQIRSERRPDSDYSALRQCYFEVHWAERLFQSLGIPFVHTTVLSIEELAVTIINRMGLQRRVF